MQENKNEEDETFDEADLNDYENITLLHTHQFNSFIGKDLLGNRNTKQFDDF
jgi:hypothetical protein